MKFLVFTLILGFMVPAMADVKLGVGYQRFQSQRDLELQRVRTNLELDYNISDFKVFAETFAEHNFSDQNYLLNSSGTQKSDSSLAEIQELYFDYNKDSFFVRIGKQAIRWSEMWTVPSLDIWTARRWDRLFYDDFKYQMNHPWAGSLTYEGEKLALDVVASFKTEADTFSDYSGVKNPDPDSTDLGARLRIKAEAFGFNILVANIHGNDYLGASGNMAFESFVVKGEVGFLDQKDKLLNLRSDEFYVAGADIFVGDLTITPQVTGAKANYLGQNDMQISYFLGLNYRGSDQNFILQYNRSPKIADEFINVSYQKYWADQLSTTFYVQRYSAGRAGLYRMLPVTADEFLIGLNLELSHWIKF